ncbi:MAG: hypothetical protein JF606_19785 [Burkholderiales bacterium]|jgi:type III secretion protein HrpB1|nr:hypothetical protein [Burkholderiales bacterium]
MNLMMKVKKKESVHALLDVLAAAMSFNLTEDAEAILACIRQLRPHLDHLDFFEGWIAIQKRDWQTATRLARGSIEKTNGWPYAYSLLAFCQYATGEPHWMQTAERVLSQNEAPEAVQLARLLLGRTAPEDIAPSLNSMDESLAGDYFPSHQLP